MLHLTTAKNYNGNFSDTPFGPDYCTSSKAFLTAPSNQIYFQCILKIFQTFVGFFIIFISFFLEYSFKFGCEFLKLPSFGVKMPSNITLKVLIQSLYKQNLNYHLIKNRLYVSCPSNISVPLVCPSSLYCRTPLFSVPLQDILRQLKILTQLTNVYDIT